MKENMVHAQSQPYHLVKHKINKLTYRIHLITLFRPSESHLLHSHCVVFVMKFTLSCLN